MEPVVEARPGLVQSAIRRRWRWIAASAVVGLLAGFGATQVLAPTYTATAVVFLNPLAGNPYEPSTSTARGDQLAALETEAALMRTTSSAQRANRSTGNRLPEQPETRVGVTVPSNSQVIRVSFTGDTPEQARLGAQAFADTYLEYRREQAEATGETQVERLTEQIEATEVLLDEATDDLADAIDAAQERGLEGNSRTVLLQQQVQTYANQLAQLQIEISAVTAGARNPGDVISPATPPLAPDGLSDALVTLGGLLVGAGIGSALALWREHSDDRLHDPHDILALGAGHVLAVLPTSRPIGAIGPDAGKGSGRLARDSAESFRLLRTAVLTDLAELPAVVTVSGVTRDIDAVGVASGLAMAVERSGRRVALVLVDTRWMVSKPTGPGLSDLLRRSSGTISDESLRDTLLRISPDLFVLGPGRSPLDSDDLVSSHALNSLLDRLRSRVDVVILAAPAVTSASAQGLAVASDAAVLVAQFERTTHDDLLEAYEALSYRRARVLGIAAVQRHHGVRHFQPADPWSTLTSRATDSIAGSGDETLVMPKITEAALPGDPTQAATDGSVDEQSSIAADYR